MSIPPLDNPLLNQEPSMPLQPVTSARKRFRPTTEPSTVNPGFSVADLTVIPSIASLPIDMDAPTSPSKVNGLQTIFAEDRLRFIGYEPSTSLTTVTHLLALMPRPRQIWMYLNIFSSISRLTSGFCSGADMVSSLAPVITSIVTLVQFSSRWEVTSYLSSHPFSVFVSVRNYNWLLVAPFKICLLVQTWAATAQDTDAIIRVYPNLPETFSQLSLSLAEGHKLLFLSPSYIHGFPNRPLADCGFTSPSLPVDLPSGMDNGCFEPISMLVISPPFPENCSIHTRPLQVIWADQSLHYRSASGLESLAPSGIRPLKSLILPFQETHDDITRTLSYLLMLALPTYCWPVSAMSPEVVEATIRHSINTSHSSSPQRGNPSSLCSPGGEGHCNV